MTEPSISKSDNRVEFGLGVSGKLLRTSLMVLWSLFNRHGARVQMLIKIFEQRRMC